MAVRTPITTVDAARDALADIDIHSHMYDTQEALGHADTVESISDFRANIGDAVAELLKAADKLTKLMVRLSTDGK